MIKFNLNKQKYPNLGQLLHPESYNQIRYWFLREKVEITDEELDNQALKSIALQNRQHYDALTVFNESLKKIIENDKHEDKN